MVGQGEDDAGGTPDIAFNLHAPGAVVRGDETVPAGGPIVAGEAVDASGYAEETSGSEDPGDAGGPHSVGDSEGVPPGEASATNAPSEFEQSGDTGRPDIFERIVDELVVTSAPSAWDRLYAEFAVTVSGDFAQVVFSSGGVETVAAVPKSVIETVRGYRAVPVEPERGPWWRLLIHATADRVIEIDYDYGAEPFPEEQLFPPEAYREDLKAYPRERLPIWLAAYIGHEGRQARSPQRAAASARADRAASVWPELAENEFPPLPVMWARWATLAAAFVAGGSEWGPRILPSLGWFESSRRSGATLCMLPGDRAVLSGGVWNAPALDETYNGAGAVPKLYAGAPEWVADPVLNPRAASGLLSFCYWWEGGRWYRGESPSAEDCAPAMPGVWTGETVADIATRVVTRSQQTAADPAVGALVAAAESGVVTEAAVIDAFGGGGSTDVDSSLYQFRLAGLMAEVVVTMPQELALTRVRQYIRGRGLDTTGYPLDELVADRLDCGWMVYVPVPRGELAIGRAIFYIADDGVLEPSSSSVPPARFSAQFEERFQQRRKGSGQVSTGMRTGQEFTT
ncbi:hypothetical protein [Nocardia jinanensis]|uniref:Uncharacterized protein n=1 Tax=Nocardia jinanensis TaxID=382504 RepID=A0A917RB40_9NOCA|nr:hypothetical protein [Nocardia jinanensis]GGK98612.1 hypothetical protein GCM10011588_11500 [Nocardia jinanensis]